jgi:hypothetical protein
LIELLSNKNLILINNRIVEMKIKIKYSYKLLLLLIGVAFIAFGFLGDDRNGVKSPKPIYKITESQASGKQGDAYGLNVNNVWMPLNRKGIIADVNVPPRGSLGQYAGGGFLFSSGFFFSGLRDGVLWANAAASASLVEDYVQGIVNGENDPNAVIYVINSQDEPFGQSWIDWIDAVELGADFYDGDGDGIYNPVDKNGNGVWDLDEDAPDLVGDELAWCVFHDGLPVAQRRWSGSLEVGLEVRQSVFAFASAGAIGNIIFVRYRFTYVGINPSDPEYLTDVYFGAWADPDLGDATDDRIGVDTVRNAGYTYQQIPDAQYGAQVPCFMIDFFSGPRSYIAGETYIDLNGNGEYDEGIDTPLDTAYSVQGQVKGVQAFPGAKNLNISSFVMYINGDQDLRDPSDHFEARNYCLGTNRVGVIPDPCTFAYGAVTGGVNCADVDPRFWFSGDPITDVGWICTENRDMRQMTNTGPFVMQKGVENEIVLAYVVGRGANPLDGITVARAIDDGAQNIFDLNFLAPVPPPAPQVTITSSDDFIDLIWQTHRQVTYVSQTPTWDLKFEGFQVFAFKTNIPVDVVSGQENSTLVARYDLNNFIKNVYKENSETGGIELLYPVSSAANQMDYSLYSDPSTGKIRLRIFNDPFNPGQKIVKGRPYYFAVTSYALNYDALVYKDDPTQPVGTIGDYYLDAFAFAQEAENVRSILSIVVGEDSYNPPEQIKDALKISGFSNGKMQYDPINNSDLTGHTYEVTFFKDDASVRYSMFWKLQNLNTSAILLDSMKQFLYGSNEISYESTEGFIAKLSDETPALGTIQFQTQTSWYDTSATKFYYLNVDVARGGPLTPIGGAIAADTSKITTADKMRRVEVRFGQNGKAYRYLQGYVGPNPPTRNASYVYAEGVTSANPDVVISTEDIGKLGEGFVDVPFTAWVVDQNYGIEKQLAVGFLERKSGSPLNGTPDGIWDPGTNVSTSGEFIFIFDADYDPNGNQLVYKGNYPASSTVWARLRGYDIPADAAATEEERRIAKSPYFNVMYTLGVQKRNNEEFYQTGDKIIIPVGKYPYTTADVFQFTTRAGGALTDAEEKNLWEKVNVYPNPLLGYNTLSNYYSNTPDEPFVTFTNLPEDITVKIYSLSGTLLRTLTTDDKDSPTSPYLRWDLENESALRVASGMFLAIVTSPKYGDKVLKFAIIMPQKQIQRF